MSHSVSVLCLLVLTSTFAMQATSQSPRYDDAPIVPTKAKMNHPLTGASAAEFGMDSMFESTRYAEYSSVSAHSS